MPRLACTVVTVLLLAPACGDDASGAFLQLGDTGGTETANQGAIEEEEAPDPTTLLECELDSLCEFPFARMMLDAEAGITTFGASDRCIFTALASGEPGLIETFTEFSDATAHLDYALLGDGVALRQASGESDALGRWQKSVFRCQLQPSEFFTECLKTPTAACDDPEQWIVACEPQDALVCPD